MKVYLDYVFFINFLFDFILLLGISIVLKRNTSKLKLFISSCFGGLSGFIILLSLSSVSFFILKLFLGFLMIIICFSYKNIKYTMNNFIYLIILSILLGGSLYLLNIEASKTIFGSSLMNNSIYIILLLIVGFIVTVVYAKYISKSKKGVVNKYKTIIYINDKPISLIGYLDTGNNLMHNNRPILILNNDIKLDLDGKKFIYIPFVTISGSGVMKCFQVKDVVVDNNHFKNIYIGISNDKFHLKDADIILNVSLWEDKNEKVD